MKQYVSNLTKAVPGVNRFLKVRHLFSAPGNDLYFAQKRQYMKSGIIIFNAILLILIGVLFYLHFSTAPKQASIADPSAASKHPTTNPDFKIAYFDMDSLAASFSLVLDAKAELNRKEEAVNAEKAKMEQNYKEKLAKYQGQAASMNQVQSESATKDMMQLQQQIQNRSQELEQEYQDYYTRKMKDVKEKIEAFLKDYNAQKGYAYIVAYEPGLFYYRDTAYNITADVIDGLNKAYKKK
jgi:outer membrane protein